MENVLFLFLTTLLLLFSRSQSHAQVEVTTIHGEKYIGFIIETKEDKILFKTTDDFELTFPMNIIEDIIPVITRIKTFNGNLYEGIVLKQDDSTMTIKTKSESVLTVPKNQIFRISYSDSYSTETYRSFGIAYFAQSVPGVSLKVYHHFSTCNSQLN